MVSGMSVHGLAVVGSVAMWGTVVEHAAGYRSRFAYPDRLRLICGRCFARGRVGAPTRVVQRNGRLAGVCDTHTVSSDTEPDPVTPIELQLELLSTYAVDLLTEQVLRAVGFTTDPPDPGLGFRAQAAYETHRLVRSRAGWLGAAVLLVAFFALRALGILASHAGAERLPVASASGPAAVAPAGSVVPDRSAEPQPTPEPERGAAPAMALIFCARVTGTVVQIARSCPGGGDALGAASSPPERRRDCDPSDAYTRKGRFSVCWLDLSRPPSAPGHALERWWLPGVHWWDIRPSPSELDPS
jgi:hypothetical protein